MGLSPGPLVARAHGALAGEVRAPGDKSISHRALIFGALAEGVSRVEGLLEGEDVLRTAAALRAFGVEIEREASGCWRIEGGAWKQPPFGLYLGNSGTGARLMMGAVAGAGIEATFHGDASLRERPMGRVLEPLRLMGVTAESRDGRLPVKIQGSDGLTAVNCKLARPSAQVKSAILLAALGADGVTTVHEPVLCRDHTERMLGVFGVRLDEKGDGEAGRYISIAGGQKLKSAHIITPGDPSSAAFLTVAALITPGSEITIRDVMVSPLRAGLYETLREMGGAISFENRREENGELVADIVARHSVLHGVEVPALRAPSMIDEYPVLAIAAAFASGETLMQGVGELRVKESDRIAAVEAGLAACGVDVASGDEWLRVQGNGEAPAGGGRVKVVNDHRIAMSFLAMGAASCEAIEIDDGSMVATSFPDFVAMMNKMGADITKA